MLECYRREIESQKKEKKKKIKKANCDFTCQNRSIQVASADCSSAMVVDLFSSAFLPKADKWNMFRFYEETKE